MDVRIVFPTLPKPPEAYDKRYFEDLTRSLYGLMTVLRSPGEGRQTTIVLTNLANNDVGLEPGTIFEVSGRLYVSVLYTSFVAGSSATGSVGSVTVTV
jgi:hypothetical protein